MFVSHFVPTQLHAAVPTQFVIEKLTLAEQDAQYLLHVGCTVDDETGLRDLLKDGAEIQLTISTTVEGHRSWWSNSVVMQKTFTSTLRHNPLTREFVLTLPDATAAPLRDRSLPRLLLASWRQLSLSLATQTEIEQLSSDTEYMLIVTFTLQHIDVPPWLKNGSMFWSADVVPEETRELKFQLPVQ